MGNRSIKPIGTTAVEEVMPTTSKICRSKRHWVGVSCVVTRPLEYQPKPSDSSSSATSDDIQKECAKRVKTTEHFSEPARLSTAPWRNSRPDVPHSSGTHMLQEETWLSSDMTTRVPQRDDQGTTSQAKMLLRRLH
ncbi:hypothetical protein MRX96_039408 [Rhipicephalus microplus]